MVLIIDSSHKGIPARGGGAAARVMRRTPDIARRSVPTCAAALTWISTGQLKQARKRLAHAAAALDDGSNRPIVVTEPSCAAALRTDLPELVDTLSTPGRASRTQLRGASHRSARRRLDAVGVDATGSYGADPLPRVRSFRSRDAATGAGSRRYQRDRPRRLDAAVSRVISASSASIMTSAWLLRSKRLHRRCAQSRCRRAHRRIQLSYAGPDADRQPEPECLPHTSRRSSTPRTRQEFPS